MPTLSLGGLMSLIGTGTLSLSGLLSLTGLLSTGGGSITIGGGLTTIGGGLIMIGPGRIIAAGRRQQQQPDCKEHRATASRLKEIVRNMGNSPAERVIRIKI